MPLRDLRASPLPRRRYLDTHSTRARLPTRSHPLCETAGCLKSQLCKRSNTLASARCPPRTFSISIIILVSSHPTCIELCLRLFHSHRQPLCSPFCVAASLRGRLQRANVLLRPSGCLRGRSARVSRHASFSCTGTDQGRVEMCHAGGLELLAIVLSLIPTMNARQFIRLIEISATDKAIREHQTRRIQTTVNALWKSHPDMDAPLQEDRRRRNCERRIESSPKIRSTVGRGRT